MQARWGSHGCYSIIALAPNSPQEIFDLTIKAFNLSEKYRIPVLVMSEAATGHMYEKVVIPPVDKIERWSRRKPSVPPEEYIPYKPDADLVPPMANAGEGYRFHVTGLTHDERGYPTMTAEAQDKLVRRLVDKIEKNKHEIIDTIAPHSKCSESVIRNHRQELPCDKFSSFLMWIAKKQKLHQLAPP